MRKCSAVFETRIFNLKTKDMIDVETLSTAMNKALHLRNVSGSLIGKKIKYNGVEQKIIDTNETEEWVITDKSIPDGIKLLWSNVELLF
jgi:light-regulated signal transduction histidine kinase (bacteriophytochrome)